MSKTTIEWTDETWNPVRGCSMAKGSEAGGCLNCYAARIAARNLPELRSPTTGKPFAVKRGAGPRWTGEVELISHKLAEPLSWRKPRRVFVNSMSDLFHEALTAEEIAAVFGVMAATPHITYQVLTKRPERAAKWFRWVLKRGDDGLSIFPDDPLDWRIRQMLHVSARRKEANLNSKQHQNHGGPWPLPNVWVGVSCENQETADTRIPHLLACPAAVRFVSLEPLLGPINLTRIDILPRIREHVKAFAESQGRDGEQAIADYTAPAWQNALTGDWFDGWDSGRQKERRLDWVIVGGESGPGARPMHPDWPRSLRDQCQEAGVPFFFKQWGEWGAFEIDQDVEAEHLCCIDSEGLECAASGTVLGGWWFLTGEPASAAWEKVPKLPRGAVEVRRLGKKAAGRLLDGREWNEMPGVHHAV